MSGENNSNPNPPWHDDLIHFMQTLDQMNAASEAGEGNHSGESNPRQHETVSVLITNPEIVSEQQTPSTESRVASTLPDVLYWTDLPFSPCLIIDLLPATCFGCKWRFHVTHTFKVHHTAAAARSLIRLRQTPEKKEIIHIFLLY